jgi:hypothetical protein
MTSFDDRWLQLARSARHDAIAPLPTDLAARARLRPAEPIPFISPRWNWVLSAAAALLTVILLPIVFDQPMPTMTTAAVRLPSPPAIESPGHYLALARNVWKGLSP